MVGNRDHHFFSELINSTMPSDKPRSFVGTCNNYTDENIAAVKAVPCKAIVCGKEIGEENGTPHLQLAIIMAKPMRFKALGKLLGGGWHIEQMKGTWEDQGYCCKDGDMVRVEDNRKQGRRNDIVAYRDAIKRKCSDMELIDTFPNECAKYSRFLPFVRKVMAREQAYKEFSHISVKVYWGAAGAGKNKMAKIWDFNEQYELALTQPKQWFGDYQNQGKILMNEFAGQWPLSQFLNWTDGNTSRYVEVKGEGTYLNNKEWIFTSNIDPMTWYKSTFDKTSNTELEAAFERRITEIVYFEKGKAPVWQKGKAP